MTAEKYMAYMENLTPIQRLAEDMHTADHNIVKMWIDTSLRWASVTEVSDSKAEASRARDIKTALSRFQIRPFYTPEEIAMLFPAIVDQLHGFRSGATPAGEISRQLRECGIPYLQCKDDPRGFRHRGMMRQYLVIADQDDWDVSLSQADFDRYMKQFPNYGQTIAKD